jgi:hypothetical protein
MWDKIAKSVRDFVFLSELSRRNAEDIRELRKRNEELSIMIERLAFEMQRTRENEAHEREKLLLRIENKALTPAKLPSKKKR